MDSISILWPKTLSISYRSYLVEMTDNAENENELVEEEEVTQIPGLLGGNAYCRTAVKQTSLKPLTGWAPAVSLDLKDFFYAARCVLFGNCKVHLTQADRYWSYWRCMEVNHEKSANHLTNDVPFAERRMCQQVKRMKMRYIHSGQSCAQGGASIFGVVLMRSFCCP